MRSFRSWALSGVALVWLVPGLIAADPRVPPVTGGKGATSLYALVVNGDDAAVHRRNVTLALEAFARLGYRSDSVYVLSGNPAAPQQGPPGRYSQPTVASLKSVVKELAKRIDANDTLVVYLTGHGVWAYGEPSVLLYDEPVAARDLVRRLLRLPFGKMIFVADTCYSGAFVVELARSSREIVAVSSTDAYHEVRCARFAQPFWQRVARIAKSDGGARQVTVSEAYQVAARELERGNPGREVLAELRTLGRLAQQDGVTFVD